MMDDDKIVRRLYHDRHSLAELGITHKDVYRLRAKGFNVKEVLEADGRKYYIKTVADNNIVLISPAQKDSTDVSWAEISDTHSGCDTFNESGLHYFLTKACAEGIKHVHHSGDLCDGYGVYNGQLNHLSYWRSEDQAEKLADILKLFPLDYYAIKGNHDVSVERSGGVPVGKIVAAMCPRFTYIDDIVADLVIDGMCKRMIHGSGGSCYAKSYSSQVYIRNLLDSDRGHIKVHGKLYRIKCLQVGHHHTEISYQTAGIHVTHPGGFQGPTDYTVRRGLVGPMGGRITKLVVRNGDVEEFDSKFILCR